MPDPDLEMRRGGKEGSVSKNFFSSLGASVWSKNYGGRAPPGSSPGSATGDGCFRRLVGRALDCRAGSHWFDSRGRTNGHGSQYNSEI